MVICFNLVDFFGLFVVGVAGIGGCSGRGREMGENRDGFGIYYFICRYIILTYWMEK